MCAWGIPNHAALERVSAIEMPVFVANGDSDPMILPHYSYLLAGLIPQAQLKIYPDAAHGFLFQHHAEFAADVAEFLGRGGSALHSEDKTIISNCQVRDIAEHADLRQHVPLTCDDALAAWRS